MSHLPSLDRTTPACHVATALSSQFAGRAAVGQFDLVKDVTLDPRTLRGLAHLMRVRILTSLREGGPATATGLAARLGESTGSTSYHLRQLAGMDRPPPVDSLAEPAGMTCADG